MEPSVRIVETKKVDFKNPVVIIGFPDVGLVGTIVSHYIIDELKLEEIGHIESQSFPPVLVIQNEKIQNMIQINGNERVIVFTSLIPIPLEILSDMTNAIANWITSKKYGTTFIVGGMPNQDRLEMKSIATYAISTTNYASGLLKEGNLQILNEGIIAGTNALLIRKFFEEKLDCIALLSDSFFAFPDPESSAVVIENLSKILGWNIDVKKLLEKGEEIRLSARELMKKTNENLDEMRKKEKETPMMYR